MKYVCSAYQHESLVNRDVVACIEKVKNRLPVSCVESLPFDQVCKATDESRRSKNWLPVAVELSIDESTAALEQRHSRPLPSAAKGSCAIGSGRRKQFPAVHHLAAFAVIRRQPDLQSDLGFLRSWASEQACFRSVKRSVSALDWLTELPVPPGQPVRPRDHDRRKDRRLPSTEALPVPLSAVPD